MNDVENTVSAGTGSDIRVMTVAFVMPMMALAAIVGFVWGSWIGGIIGAALWVGWLVWWRSKHKGKFFPRDVQTGPFVITLIIAAIVFFVTLGIS
ncbi:hypothetical protein [Herbihabitans rhizosphaerae]|uniref:hypothetical protein n=1 Tax=Herbihabitans rhizosphaerae TaxID=1872711 RepID=UPI00102C9C0B|nr:hypothetical protein [Herbihabitans rhizosphaerae]